jgi:hypothetical protein
MTAQTALSDLESRGVVLSAQGSKLKWTAPKGIVDAKLVGWLRSHKAELLTALNDRVSKPAGPIRKAALITVPDGVPLEWAEGVVRVLAMPAPRPYDSARWQEIREDAFSFLRDWGAQAHRLGWSDLDLFGVHPRAPIARLDAMGLVPLLGGNQVVALTCEGALIVTRSGVRQTFHCHREGVVPAEICLLWDLGADEEITS